MRRSLSVYILVLYSMIVVVFGLTALLLAENTTWRLIAGGVYTLLLLLLMFRGVWRALGAWSAFFVVLQTVASDLLLPQMHTLEPNTQKILSVSNVSGISGVKKITTDGLGFRSSGNIEYDDHKRFRIFALGASTTEQALLDDSETWTNLLQEKLRFRGLPVEVVNTGVAGLRAKHVLATLKRVSELNPDLILLLTGINDWNDHIRLHHSPRHKWARFDFSRSPIASMVRIIWRRTSREHAAPARGTATPHPLVEWTINQAIEARSRPIVAFMPEDVHVQYKRAMEDIAEECRQIKVPCVFLSQPTLYSTGLSSRERLSLWMTPYGAEFRLDLKSLVHISELYNNWLRRFACTEGMYFYDLAGHIPKEGSYMYDDVHFTEQGAAAVANTLLNPIESILLRSVKTNCCSLGGCDTVSMPEGNDGHPGRVED